MTIDDISAIGFPIEEPTQETLLYIESALDWLSENTSLEFNKKDTESIKALPAGAKLFVSKFCDITTADSTVASESLGGMSQSFTTTSQYDSIMGIAQALLGPYLKSAACFIPAKRRWR